MHGDQFDAIALECSLLPGEKTTLQPLGFEKAFDGFQLAFEASYNGDVFFGIRDIWIFRLAFFR
jgi:hypothetical protein